MESQPQNPEFRNNPEKLSPMLPAECVVSLSKTLSPLTSNQGRQEIVLT